MKDANLKIYLKNFEDLMIFLNANYQYIDDNSYYQLLYNTLNVYPMEKPTDKEKALKELEDFYTKYSSSKEKPIFLHVDFEEEETTADE